MKRIWILGGVAFLLVAFVLGVFVGSWRGARPAAHPPALTTGTSSAPAASAAGGCTDFREVASQVGTAGCVTGQVLRVFTSRNGNSFLDFCPDYRNCPFTSVIFASDKDKFGDLGTLQGKRVEIHGNITVYQGRAEIIIHAPQQIRSAP